MLKNIPEELKVLPQWVIAGRDKNLYNPRNKKQANVNDSRTWGTFEEAKASGSTYIGFVLTQKDPYCIIDLDNKASNPCTPEQWARHIKILDAFDSYTEYSASGTGYHIIIKGEVEAGLHRDNVEVYSSGRYMICTGNVVRQKPIQDYQELLDVLFSEMKPPVVPLKELGDSLQDQEIFSMASSAVNADKFNTLCSGDLTGYPSQSEADFALLSILAFYSQSNEQCRRLFRMTAIGKRAKAIRNDTYLNYALGKIRAQQPPPINFEEVAANAERLLLHDRTGDQFEVEERFEPENQPLSESESNEVPVIQPNNNQSQIKHETPPAKQGSIILPPGLVGQLAEYFLHTAVRPVPEIALTAAIGLMAGISGRAFNVSGTGLNQYIILLARTGSGKEGILTGIDSILSAVRPTVPMAMQFMGPAAFASGQALIKVLDEKPCFVSVLGEFGLTLQEISDRRANSAQVMLRKVLLDLYAKSGWNRNLYSSTYSDKEKNTQVVQAPNVTILGESTPETFFDGLDTSHIAEGLIPRFSIVEYTGPRPPRNLKAFCPPSTDLIQKVADLIAISLTTQNNNQCIHVRLDAQSQALMDQFDTQADRTMNNSENEVEVQLWNRAHLKALKLAALLAVGINPHQPIITQDQAQWAIDFCSKDIGIMVKRFSSGDVGAGDSKQFNDLKRVIKNYLKRPYSEIEKYGVCKAMYGHKIVPYAYLIRTTSSLLSYRTDRLGATQALKKQLQALSDSGMINEVHRNTLSEKYGNSGVAYAIGKGWKS